MPPPIDQPGELEAGAELNVARLDRFLREAGLDLPPVEPIVRQFPGGASNLTYLLRWEGEGRERELILRRPPFGHKAKSAHDMQREAAVLQTLHPVYPAVPQVIATCADPEVLGSDFYVMERLRGIILRRDLPPGMSLAPDQAHRLCCAVLDKLIELHALPTDRFAALGRGEGYVRRQVAGWCDRYRRARTTDAADFETVMAWLARHQPERDTATCLLHNDFRFDNVVLDAETPSRVVGVLDWEMATLGDPLADLGNSLAYWVQADDPPELQRLRRQPTHLPGMLTRSEVLAYYGERTGLAVDRFDFYLVYGTFRLAGIAQQIYYRFRQAQAQGQAGNPAFAAFGPMTHVLERRCLELL